MKKTLQKKSIYHQLALLAITTVVLIAAMFTVAFYTTKQNIKKQNQEYISNLTIQLEQVVMQNYTTYSKIMRLVSYDNDVQDFLLAEKPENQIALYSIVKQNLTSYATLNDQILDIIILDKRGYRYGLADNMLYPLSEKIPEGSDMVVDDLNTVALGGVQTSYLTTIQNIYSTSNYLQSNQKIGAIYFILEPNAFTGNEKFADFEGDCQIFLVDGADHVVWYNTPSGTQEQYNEVIKNTQNYEYYEDVPLETLGFSMVACQETAWMFGSANDGSVVILILFAALFLMIAGIWILWARNIVKPLTKLTRFVETVSKPDLNSLKQKISLYGYHEVEVLSSEINHMLEEIYWLTQELIVKNADLYESELLVKQSELMHLRSQINPHFLYNTLETMVGIAYTENQPYIAEIARALSLIFKYSIKGDNIVPLRDELKISKSYVLIQKSRFEDRFDTRYEIDDACLNVQVPKMILQPLIENAIVHGIEQQENQCMLLITAKKEKNKLVITVMDDGKGIAPDELKQIHNRLKKPNRTPERQSKHIGLQNVNDRLCLMFGEENGLIVESSLSKGTCVKIILPFETL